MEYTQNPVITTCSVRRENAGRGSRGGIVRIFCHPPARHRTGVFADKIFPLIFGQFHHIIYNMVANVHESAENYLETILVLGLKGDPVRSIDIVNELEYSKPSVSVAMKNLREKGYIAVDGEGHITLTEKGRKIADSMYERHVAISDWLIFLCVDKKTAVQDACKMEHAMSEKSFLAIKKYIETRKRDTSKKNKHPDNRG
jgi:Mn-dependent DtxR family transcriptional regulator